jgi:hypothetical protein
VPVPEQSALLNSALSYMGRGWEPGMASSEHLGREH